MNQEKICLLVEDDPDDQEFFIDVLHDISSTTGCYAVANGEEALDVLMQEGLRPDFIFTDLHMPRMDGFNLVRKLQSIPQLKDIPVVVYTSDYTPENIETAKKLGVDGIYSKLRMNALSSILERFFLRQPHTVL